MAKRTMNRKEQRLPMDEQEMDSTLDLDGGDDEESGGKRPKKKVKKAVKRTVAAAKEVRLKAFWAVYSQSLQCVKLFEYGDKAGADKLAAELTEAKKAPHFVRLEKQIIE